MNSPFLKQLVRVSALPLAVFFCSLILALQTHAAGPNLLPNSDLRETDPTNALLPLQWHRGGWGTNIAIHNYPVPGFDDLAAVQVIVAAHTSGDVKWYTDPVPVTAGDRYVFTDRYKATVPTILTAEYQLSSGALQYQYLLTAPPAVTWAETRTMLTIPANTVSVRIYHLLSQVGELTFDVPSLTKEDSVTPPPSEPGNLLANGSFETTALNDPTLPQQWSKSGWGTNDRTFTYPVAGHTSAKAASLTISSYTDGDAKWSFPPVVTTTAQALVFRDYYTATVPTVVTAAYVLQDGSRRYVDLATLDPATNWTRINLPFTPPADIQSVTIYHLLNRVGTLTIDSAYLSFGSTTSPPPGPTNLIANADLSQASPEDPDLPLAWSRGNWGINQAVLTYPVAGTAGMNGLEVRLTSQTTGDAKWMFDAVPVTPGLIYRYTEYYKATVPSVITARYDFANGVSTYVDLMYPNPTETWTPLHVSVSPPTGAQTMAILHLIEEVGTLTMSGFLLPQPSTSSTSLFSEGMVSFTFDDGYLGPYEVARPMLNQAGIKASFYLVNDHLLYENSAYMTTAQALALNGDGHEIGGHTRTHSFLSQLLPAQLHDETVIARQDLLATGFTPVNTFVYPYGDYNDAVIQALKTAGYLGARSVQTGFNDKLSDPYLLRDQHIESDTTVAQVEAWIDQAKTHKTWLILEFHQVGYNAGQYSNTPETMQGIVHAVKNSGIKTVTLGEGLALMQE